MARLFGAASVEATAETRSAAQWRRSLRKALDELHSYAQTNVETDDMHWFMICTAFASAHESLKEENFWPGFVEGLVRLNLLLLGDYPDHRKRKSGKKRNDHYRLNRLRSIHYAQNTDQKVRALYAAPRLGFPKLSVSPDDAMSEFRQRHGYGASYGQFIRWFKATYPTDYALLF